MVNTYTQTKKTKKTKKGKKPNKESRNPIQDRGRKEAMVDPKGSVASPEGDREQLEEMTGGGSPRR